MRIRAKALKRFNTEASHITVFVSAWTYFLSASWAELMPVILLKYTDSEAYNTNEPEDRDSVVIDVGANHDGVGCYHGSWRDLGVLYYSW